MGGLGKTVANMLARSRAMTDTLATSTTSLVSVTGFGSNPGALRMLMHKPEGIAEGAPLVVVLHGCGQTAGGYAANTGWLELADRFGFAVLCPEQTRANNANLCFNWFEKAHISRGAGQAASIAQMVLYALDTSNLDPRRVFVTGLSAGGAMAAVMLATYPELFAGGAIIAGLPYGAAAGVNQALSAMRHLPSLSARAWGDKVRAAAPPPERWPRVSVWHGDADTTVAPAAAEALALQWSDVQGATPSTSAAPDVAGRKQSTWLRADGSIAVELHRIAGLAHGAPIAASGKDGCGAAAPWILEAGVSSSLEIAQSWNLTAVRRNAGARRAPSDERITAKSADAGSLSNDVAETITHALRRAGLMR